MNVRKLSLAGLVLCAAICMTVPAVLAADVPWDAGGADDHWFTAGELGWR